MTSSRRSKKRFGVAWLLAAAVPVTAIVVLFGYREYRYSRLRAFCTAVEAGQTRDSVAAAARSRGMDYWGGMDHRDFVSLRSMWPGLGWCIVEHDGSKVLRKKVEFE